MWIVTIDAGHRAFGQEVFVRFLELGPRLHVALRTLCIDLTVAPGREALGRRHCASSGNSRTLPDCVHARPVSVRSERRCSYDRKGRFARIPSAGFWRG